MRSPCRRRQADRETSRYFSARLDARFLSGSPQRCIGSTPPLHVQVQQPGNARSLLLAAVPQDKSGRYRNRSWKGLDLSRRSEKMRLCIRPSSCFVAHCRYCRHQSQATSIQPDLQRRDRRRPSELGCLGSRGETSPKARHAYGDFVPLVHQRLKRYQGIPSESGTRVAPAQIRKTTSQRLLT